jgi:hypothetical protein
LVKSVSVENKGFMQYLNASSGYRFNKGFRLNADLTIVSDGISKPQSTSNGFTSYSFSVQKNLAKDKLTLAASVANALTKYRHNREKTAAPDFIQVADNQLYFRSFGFSLNYRFGKLKESIKKNKRGINNDDLSN